MRVVSWNIRHGGGRRRDAVYNTLVGHAPNIIVLTEYRSGPGLLLVKSLAEVGWPHVATSNPAPRRNGIAVVSRRPFTVYRPPGSVPPDRWVEVEVPDYGLALAAVYVPIRGNDVKPKDAYWRAVLKEAATRRGSPFLCVGDWNTGDRIGDAEPEGRSFSCSEHFAAMAEEGFVEAWRLLHPHQSAFSWYSRRRGADGNGFRIDHAFLSEQLRQRLVSCEYSDIERAGGISDHAALVLNLRF